MKILAIRGKNLASLSAEFVVDFLSEPLASAGLYAITGPTGSGKSTLLDALCLALYERTPRLQKAAAKGESIPDVGDNAVSPADPRTILRRGASEGFAEVDFVGNDAVAYRARWSVRRARLKADGKLQASEISLLRISDAQALGDNKKTETLRLIEGYIGLSFEQFTRAVLLAQNDFATFLKAPDDERAELLQTLTGTETFSNLSKQAYARMKLENEALGRLQEQLKGQQPLTAEARTEKEVELQRHTAQADALATRKAQTEGQQRWYQQHAKCQQELAEASALHAAAMAGQDAAAPRRAQLGLVEQVQGARPLWIEQQRLRQAMATVAQELQLANAQGEQARQQAHSCQAACAQAEVQASAAEMNQAQTQPALAQARALDASMLAVTPECLAAEQAQAAAQAHLEAQKRQQAQMAQDSAAAQAELARTQAWLNRQAPLRALSEGWQRWDTLFANAQGVLASRSKVHEKAAALALQAASTSEQLGSAQTAMQQAKAQADAAQTQLDTWTQACAAVDIEALVHRKQALQDQREQLQAATLLWHQRSEVRGQRQKLQAQQQAHSATLSDAERVLQECAQQLPLLGSALHSAEQALQLATMAASQNAQTLREQLQADQACPVCGATDHPYADHVPALNAVLQGLQAHVQQARQALNAVQERSAVASANRASASVALEQGRLELTQRAAQRDTLLQDWAGLALQAELDAVPEPERSAWLQQQENQARQALAQLAEREAAQRLSLKHRDAAQQAVNTANQALTQARDALALLTHQASQINQTQASAQQQLAEQAQLLDGTLAQLDAAFVDSDWRQAWHAEPEDFVAQCRSDAQAWAQQQQSHTALTHSLAELQLQLSAMDSACAQAAQQLGTQTERLALAQASLQGYRQQRADLLQGLSVPDVEASLQAAVAAARKELEATQAALQRAQTAAARQQEAARLAQQQQDQMRQAQATAQAALDQWLMDFNSPAQGGPHAAALDANALQTLLAVTPAWITQERQELQALQNAVTTALAVLDTRRQSLTEHEKSKATEHSAQELQDQLLALNTEVLALTQTVSALQLDLARDGERLAASLALRAQIEEQSAVARVWSQLGELIGSADGKKFRNFAQQLTLDILLGYGNSHLHTLSKRYRIQRIADSLGLLVVDQDMGDEVRSVHSLSGGESFLVSLAMALGLASLSSHRVRVESLFIDEGFGSLDADSLRVAMDALDSLQSLGRKVGVISHVQEMTERIGTRVQLQRQVGGQSRIVVT